jgi:hypothetical protein
MPTGVPTAADLTRQAMHRGAYAAVRREQDRPSAAYWGAYGQPVSHETGSPRTESSGGASGWMSTSALLAGVLIAAITVASQPRSTGRVVSRWFGGDLLNVALLGLATAAVIAAVTAAVGRGRRAPCVVGLVLSLSPVALLAYYFYTSPG